MEANLNEDTEESLSMGDTENSEFYGEDEQEFYEENLAGKVVTRNVQDRYTINECEEISYSQIVRKKKFLRQLATRRKKW